MMFGFYLFCRNQVLASHGFNTWAGFDYSNQIGPSLITMATAKCGESNQQYTLRV